MTTVLLVDADAQGRTQLARELGRSGHHTFEAETAATGLALARERQPALVLSEFVLPDLEGTDFLHLLRQDLLLGIILVTLRAEEADLIEGLDAGADDYVVKPFSLGELMARMRAVVRRVNLESRELRAGELCLDLIAHRAYIGTRTLPLSPKEFALLTEFLRHRGAVLSGEWLARQVWGDPLRDLRTVQAHISSVRQKIDDRRLPVSRIQTVRGIGYRFDG